jgi:parallel beta-helix repeat protein
LRRNADLLNSLVIALLLIALQIVVPPIGPVGPIGPIGPVPGLGDNSPQKPQCDLVVDEHGHDSASGTVDDPLRTSKKAVKRLRNGQTLCFRAGTYPNHRALSVRAKRTTIRPYGNEHATLRGELRIERPATGTIVEDLTLDGRNRRHNFNPIIFADQVVLRGNEITNEHTTNCIHLARYFDHPPPRGDVIENNNIHDCGVLPPSNLEHGIYVAASRDLTIRNNLIWNNADRGIQLYTDVKRTQVYGNVINGNGVGVIMSGAGGVSASGTLIAHNFITNSTVRHNVESFFPHGTPPGRNNIVRDNCIHGAVGFYAGPDGSGIGEQDGFTATDNINADPGYADPEHGDFRFPADSPCAGVFEPGQGPASVTGG